MKIYTEKNRVVSFSRSSAAGVAVAMNKWFEDNTDGKDSEAIYVRKIVAYFDGSQHNGLIYWYFEEELEKEDEKDL